jgi:phosphomannomutase
MSASLKESLSYEPRELKFGTSGRRGLVVDLTQLEIYINALAEVEYLQTLSAADGGIVRGDAFYIGFDLRPSSPRLGQAVVQAVRDAGMEPVNLGRLPTPALTYFALLQGKGSIMVTGSHIPFDRNGYKLNTARGELLKKHETPINAAVQAVRGKVYGQPFAESGFDASGAMQTPPAVPEAIEDGLVAYTNRYVEFFAGGSLAGARLLVYQHSAVGRDLLADLLQRLGAEVVPCGRSETFVPIDTENIDAEQLAAIQALADEHPGAFAVVSTDGDSDRPLLLGVDANNRVQFFGGDLLGMIVADYLGADAVVVPISSNDAIDRGKLAPVLEPKTKIGSPFVIEGMERACAKGRKVVCGWEANGGFLTGSDIWREGAVLKALPTRDAVLPLLCALFAARGRGVSLGELLAELPKRFSKAALLKNYPRETSRKVVEFFSPPRDEGAIRAELEGILGSAVARLDYTDGVRVILENGEVVHFRPSGNADEFRIYAVADTQARADAWAARGVAEPDGILRRLEKAVQ